MLLASSVFASSHGGAAHFSRAMAPRVVVAQAPVSQARARVILLSEQRIRSHQGTSSGCSSNVPPSRCHASQCGRRRSGMHC